MASNLAARPGRAAAAGHYEEQAVGLLSQALERVPAGQRPAFWKDYIRADAALNPLHRNAGFLRLAARYAEPR